MKIIFYDKYLDILTLFSAYLYIYNQKNVHFSFLMNISLQNVYRLIQPGERFIFTEKDQNHNSVFLLKKRNINNFKNLAEKNIVTFNLNPYHNLFLKTAAILRKCGVGTYYINICSYRGILQTYRNLKKDIELFASELVNAKKS